MISVTVTIEDDMLPVLAGDQAPAFVLDFMRDDPKRFLLAASEIDVRGPFGRRVFREEGAK